MDEFKFGILEKIYHEDTDTYEYTLRAASKFSIPVEMVEPMGEGFIYQELKSRLINHVLTCSLYKVHETKSQEKQTL